VNDQQVIFGLQAFGDPRLVGYDDQAELLSQHSQGLWDGGQNAQLARLPEKVSIFHENAVTVQEHCFPGGRVSGLAGAGRQHAVARQVKTGACCCNPKPVARAKTQLVSFH
jgi:hypothetical protein